MLSDGTFDLPRLRTQYNIRSLVGREADGKHVQSNTADESGAIPGRNLPALADAALRYLRTLMFSRVCAFYERHRSVVSIGEREP